ncbi:MAG: AAC(3) family N-acetyltransferase [Ruminococcaceae bacterium]|nr:AAC(3) family N-acetyltransferase [Oscillospiraceae bacterium]
MSYTKQDLKAQLAQMGITPTDRVLIHTSYKSVGEIEGGPDAFLDAFCEYLSEGLLIVPTHTWANVNRQNPVYRVHETVPCIGLIPRLAAVRRDGIRSLHPTHSVWAHGVGAEELVRGEELARTPAPVGGTWWRFGELGVKILLIGVGLERNTYIHAVDEIAALGRLSDKGEWEVTVVDAAGQEYVHPFRGHANTGSDNFGNFEEAFATLGVMKYARLGDAEVRVVDARACRDVLLAIYSRTDEHLCLTPAQIPRALWEDLRI